MNAEQLPVDPHLPQLQTLWNAAAMAKVLRAQLQSNRPKAAQIESCTISRIRYRAAQRSVVLYDVLLIDHNGQTSHCWITAFTYADKSARRLYRRLRDSLPHIPLDSQFATRPSADLKPLACLPELNTVIQTFPTDRYLPQIAQLMEQLPLELERCLARHLGASGGSLNHAVLIPQRYRPGFGATLRLDIFASDRGPAAALAQQKTLFLKLYRQGTAKPAYEKMLNLQPPAKDNCGFRLAQPLALINSLDAIVIECAPGESLEELLKQPENVPQTMDLVAAGLWRLHNSDLKLSSSRLTPQLMTRNRRAVDFLQWACPQSRELLASLWSRWHTLSSDTVIAPTHCDLKPEHIFLQRAQVTFIDVDSMAIADPVYDLAVLMIRLKAMPILGMVSNEVADLARQALAEGYFNRAPSDWSNRLIPHMISAGLKLALYIVQHQLPEWRGKTLSLLREIEQLTADPCELNR